MATMDVSTDAQLFSTLTQARMQDESDASRSSPIDTSTPPFAPTAFNSTASNPALDTFTPSPPMPDLHTSSTHPISFQSSPIHHGNSQSNLSSLNLPLSPPPPPFLPSSSSFPPSSHFCHSKPHEKFNPTPPFERLDFTTASGFRWIDIVGVFPADSPSPPPLSLSELSANRHLTHAELLARPLSFERFLLLLMRELDLPSPFLLNLFDADAQTVKISRHPRALSLLLRGFSAKQRMKKKKHQKMKDEIEKENIEKEKVEEEEEEDDDDDHACGFYCSAHPLKRFTFPVALFLTRSFVLSVHPQDLFGVWRLRKNWERSGRNYSRAHVVNSLIHAVARSFEGGLVTWMRRVEEGETAYFRKSNVLIEAMHGISYVCRAFAQVTTDMAGAMQLYRNYTELLGDSHTEDLIREFSALGHHFQELQDSADTLISMHINFATDATNKKVSVLTKIVVVFLPITFFTAVYAMNFNAGVPETKWDWYWGYIYFWLLEIAVVILMLLFFWLLVRSLQSKRSNFRLLNNTHSKQNKHLINDNHH